MRSFALALGLVLIGVPASHAQPPSPSVELPAEARPRFELATALYTEGRYVEAAQEFQRVYELTGEAAVLFNVHLSWRNAGRSRESAAALREYLARETDVPERAVLERQLAQLEEAAGGDTPPADPPANPPTPGPRPAAGPDLTGPAILVAAGGAALLASGVTGGLALFAHDELEEACEDGMCPEASAGDVSAHRSLAITTDVLWITGAVAIGAGLTWLIVALTGEQEGPPPAAALECSAQGCNAVARGVF